MLKVKDVAQYFLAQAEEECGDTISNLKLQKLCYYAQGFHLAFYDKPLFCDMIEPWEHGPVIPALYSLYKEYKAQAIPAPTKLDFSKYDKRTKDLLDEVYKVYGQFSAWKLRNLSHNEATWVNAYKSGEEISHASMKKYFKTLVKREA
jgi:uncharacterized phage-associated protein